MKILWVFVILATVNGNQEVCPKVTDASGDEVVSNRWGKAEGDLPDVRMDPRPQSVIYNLVLETMREM